MRMIEFPDGTVRRYNNGTMLWPIYPKKIIIEPVYGCDKRCVMCSLAGMPKDVEPKYMTEELFYTRILAAHKGEDLNVVNFAGIGEPTMHPSFIDFVTAMREAFPKKTSIKTYTNGFLFRKAGDLSPLQDMIKAGLNLILIDAYDAETAALVEADADKFGIVNCYDENVFKHHKGTVIAYNPPRQALFQEITAIRRPDTQGGVVPYENWKRLGVDPAIFPVNKRCNKATKSIHIMYDGHVNMCCADNSRSFWMGDLTTQTPREVWQSRDFDIVRYAMNQGLRELLPTCYTCDRRSFRVGLYPHAGDTYTREEILDMAERRFKPTEQLLVNMRKLHAEYPISNTLLREAL